MQRRQRTKSNRSRRLSMQCTVVCAEAAFGAQGCLRHTRVSGPDPSRPGSSNSHPLTNDTISSVSIPEPTIRLHKTLQSLIPTGTVYWPSSPLWFPDATLIPDPNPSSTSYPHHAPRSHINSTPPRPPHSHCDPTPSADNAAAYADHPPGYPSPSIAGSHSAYPYYSHSAP